MARTRERAKVRLCHSEEKKQMIYNMAGYVRLSEESKRSDSESIENQKYLIQNFVKENSDMVLFKFYVDDGFTGTNFKRSGFLSMMDDIRNGVIHGIIVKDVSRFGREYLEVGDYIEKVFPFLGVRFISIMDHYDSAESGADKEKLILSLKNLVYDLYPKDISKRIYSAYRVTQMKGEARRGNLVPYGYTVAAGEKYYRVEDEAAKIVGRIFNWKCEGISLVEISKRLLTEQVLTPNQHRVTGRVYGDEYLEAKLWATNSIKRILKNEEYLGHRIVHKTEVCLYKEVKHRRLPQDMYVVLEDKHTAIISDEDFDRVQVLMNESSMKYTQKARDAGNVIDSLPNHMFEGLIFCGDCKRSMSRRNQKIKIDGEQYYRKKYVCSLQNQYSGMCSRKTITEMDVCKIVFRTIQSRLLQIKDLEKQIQHRYHTVMVPQIAAIENEKKAILRKRKDLEKGHIERYMTYAEGKMAKAQFLSDKEENQENKLNLEQRLERLDKREKELKRLEKRLKKITTEFLCCDTAVCNGEDYLQLNRELIQTFVNRIYVYENHRIEIELRYEDEIKLLMKEHNEVFAKEGRAEWISC